MAIFSITFTIFYVKKFLQYSIGTREKTLAAKLLFLKMIVFMYYNKIIFFAYFVKRTFKRSDNFEQLSPLHLRTVFPISVKKHDETSFLI
jgi:hypothetical protein